MYIYLCICTHVGYTQIHIYLYTCIYIYMCTHTRTHHLSLSYTQFYEQIHLCIRFAPVKAEQNCVAQHANTHARTHTQSHTRTHAHMYTCAHAHTCTCLLLENSHQTGPQKILSAPRRLPIRGPSNLQPGPSIIAVTFVALKWQSKSRTLNFLSATDVTKIN